MTESNVPSQPFEAAQQANDQFRAFGEQTTQQVREFGEQAAQASRGYADLALQTYEQSVATIVEFEQKAAEAAPADWMKTAIDAHAGFVKDVNDAYLKAIRGALTVATRG
jgi:hypothetical protein